MSWGVWVEWNAYNDGRPKPAGREWIHTDHEPVTFACESDAIQRAAIYRTNMTERGWQGYMAENLTLVQARRFTPLNKGELVTCEPDLSGLTGFFTQR